MKKILVLLTLVLTVIGCNQEKVFPDYDYTAVYFPVQYPVRTLSLGNDRIDNSLDKELKFHIGISIGGLYVNKRSWTVSFIYKPELAKNLQTADGDTVMLLPEEYYTITPADQVVIPSGEFNGLMEVQLTDEFLDDPLAFGNHYVIPLEITETSADSVLRGKPVVEDPDRRVAADWESGYTPKDFTLFMIKFVNPYHGYWLHRGVDYVTDAGGNPVDTIVYHEKYLVDNKIWELATSGRNTVVTNGIANNLGSNHKMSLEVNPDTKTIEIDSIAGSSYMVKGIGESKWIEEGDVWGDEQRETMYLNYTFNDGTNTHIVYDTLVFRDRGIHYEEFIPVVLE
ncbi:MAG: DUF1735 domain-containing protein [Chlorobi bacterium]|nr:DUF1735 domain-containing protein [Chlorobiota bacterium]